MKRQVIPGVYIEPRISETARGKVEFDLTAGDGPVIMSVHGGLGGADQGRLIADWVAGQGYRILSPSRPGYLGTPLDSGATVGHQADLLAALLDTLEISQVALLSYSAGGPVAFSLGARRRERVVALVAISSLSGPQLIPGEAGRVRAAIFLSTPGQQVSRFVMDKVPRAFLNDHLTTWGSWRGRQPRCAALTASRPGGWRTTAAASMGSPGQDYSRIDNEPKRGAAGDVERQVSTDVYAAQAHDGDGGQDEGAAGRPQVGKGGGAQGNGDASVPRQVSEPSGLAPAATGAGQQDGRPGPSHHPFDQFRKRPGASAAGQELHGQFTLTCEPGRASSGRGSSERAQLHDDPGGHVDRAGQAVDGAERLGLPRAYLVAARGRGRDQQRRGAHAEPGQRAGQLSGAARQAHNEISRRLRHGRNRRRPVG